MLETKYFEEWKNEKLAYLVLCTARLWPDSFKSVSLLIEGRKVLAGERETNQQLGCFNAQASFLIWQDRKSYFSGYK